MYNLHYKTTSLHYYPHGKDVYLLADTIDMGNAYMQKHYPSGFELIDQYQQSVFVIS